jgi:hypothetical protein
MDNPLEIPDAAYAAGWHACTTGSDRDELLVTRVVNAAAPLIVAAAYRSRARECNCMHDAELLNCAADKLDHREDTPNQPRLPNVLRVNTSSVHKGGKELEYWPACRDPYQSKPKQYIATKYPVTCPRCLKLP